MAAERAHKAAPRFDFRLERHTAVIICSCVKGGAPILHVSHDADGDWQFLCGAPHDDEGPDAAAVTCLECVVADDPSLNDVADMCSSWSAYRDRSDAAWKRHDHFEDAIKTAVTEHGWFVAKIEGGVSNDEPAFAYTVGLFKTYGHPELTCIGLRTDLMHVMLNNCGQLIKTGQQPPVGPPFDEVLDDFKVQLREVRARESYDEHMGYAIWFNGGSEFPLLQLVWPDKEGRFPGDPGASPWMVARQPLLP